MRKLVVQVTLLTGVLLTIFTQPVLAVNVYSQPSNSGWIQLKNTTTNNSWTMHSATDGNNLEFVATESNGTNHWQALSINKNGNVGIGTNSASTLLHLKSGANPIIKLEGNETNGLLASDSNIILRMNDDADTWENYIAFQEYTGSFIMTVSAASGGQVGIGTTRPTRKLSVNGTVLAKEVLVTTQAQYWPDYVFNNDYKLMSLEDLEAYMNTNKHLPNILSAEDLEKTGLSLGEMQKKQMQKIEELTLYTIKADKEIKALKTENNELAGKFEQMQKELNEIRSLIK